MVSRSEINFILEIEEQRKLFEDSDFWMQPEEQHRLKALRCKQKADLGDTISMLILEGKSISYELRKLRELKKRRL